MTRTRNSLYYYLTAVTWAAVTMTARGFLQSSISSSTSTPIILLHGKVRSFSSFGTKSRDRRESLVTTSFVALGQLRPQPNHKRSNDAAAFSLALATTTTTSNNEDNVVGDKKSRLQKLKLAFSKVGMISFVLSMVVFLPLTLLPTQLLRRTRLLSKNQSEALSLRTGQFCARWCLRFFPFVKIKVVIPPPPPPGGQQQQEQANVPSVWVCNHMSMLDIFILLASDHKMRGPHRRPMKIVYWKALESNPVNKIFFRMCGFIPIAMAPNEPGEANQYDRSSFKTFLKMSKQAFVDGFDIGILPEGQLNPNPSKGLLPIFPGAYSLARMSRRPLRMLALHGTNDLWHARDGMCVRNNVVTVRAYPGGGRAFESVDDFSNTFERVVGHFGAKGVDLENWRELLM